MFDSYKSWMVQYFVSNARLIWIHVVFKTCNCSFRQMISNELMLYFIMQIFFTRIWYLITFLWVGISQNTLVLFRLFFVMNVTSINLVKSLNSNDCITICLINYLNSCISTECDFLGLRIFSHSPVLFYNRLQISSVLAFCASSTPFAKAFKSCCQFS